MATRRKKKTKMETADLPAKSRPQHDSNQNNQQAKAQYLAEFHTHSGPLPSPAVLNQYDQIVPGAAERIISMAEEQMRHRHSLEKKAIESEIADSRLGLHYGLIIGLASVIGGAICIIFGHEIGGSIIGGAGLSGLVGVFVYGTNQRRKERESRWKMEQKQE